MADIDGPGIAAIITGTGAAVAAVIGAIRLQRGAKNSEMKTPETPLPPVPSTFDGEQVLDFLKELRADNADLRRRDGEKTDEIQALQSQLTEMGDEIKLSNRVQEAFQRWTMLIFQAWGKTDRPPLPEGDDLMLLKNFIPR